MKDNSNYITYKSYANLNTNRQEREAKHIQILVLDLLTCLSLTMDRAYTYRVAVVEWLRIREGQLRHRRRQARMILQIRHCKLHV